MCLLITNIEETFYLYLSKANYLWIVRKISTNQIATAPIHAAKKEFAVIALPITDEAVSCRHVIFRQILNRAMTDPLTTS
jgi:hypothetical protein